MGRSRGGLTTKIHATVNENGLPLAFHLTPGQSSDIKAVPHLLNRLQPNQLVLADKAYDADWVRQLIWEQGAIDVIPSKTNRIIPKDFDREVYKMRNKVECFFGRIKASFRRIATRYDKHKTNYLAFIKLAAVRLWCQFYESAA